ncbi:MAG TPA: DUF3618 domain-containing protein [Candidatus Limnocylindrales bacterium]|nr:DUF3618 domain-containing protein [Candidatus Limnocylindrales bacterium]
MTDRTTGIDPALDDDVDAETAEKVIEIELTREEMHETVEAIGERLTPAAIAESAKETVRDATVGKVEDMAQSARGALDDASTTASEARNGIIDTIRQNPIPAAMAGIGLAWLWTHRSQGQTYTSGTWRRGSDYYGEPRYAGDRYGETYRYGGSGGAKEGVSSKVGEVGDRVSDVGDRVSERAGQAVESVSDQFDRLGDRMSDVPDQMGYRVQDLSEQARNLIEDSPLAVGAVAVAVGTAIGAAIPATSTERRVLRPAAERAIGTAEERATEALEQAEQRMSEATSGQGSSGTSRGRSGSGGSGSGSSGSSSSSSGSTSSGSSSGATGGSSGTGSTSAGSGGSTGSSGASAGTSGTSGNRTRLRQTDASS